MRRPPVLLIALLVLFRGVGTAYSDTAPRLEAVAVRAAVASVRPRVVRLRYLGGAAGGVLGDAAAPATGLLVEPAGWIVTSLYGLEETPETVIASFHDGARRPARLVARDLPRRIALLKTDAPVESGKDFAVGSARVGQRAVAVGWTRHQQRTNVSVGIVSAVGRFSGRAVQTDAAVSPANYGGPLLALDGRLLGVVSPLAPAGQDALEWYDSGIGFAVPWSQIAPRLERMKTGHDIEPGWLGVELAGGSPLFAPAVVVSVSPEGPASRCGLRGGDRLTAINGAPTPTVAGFRRLLGSLDAGDACRLALDRGGQRLVLRATLGTVPSAP